MLKRTLYFSNPYHLSIKNEQLIISSKENNEERQAPIEDLGFVVFEHPQITFSQSVIEKLSENNVAVIFCNSKYLPVSMLFHLDTHQIQNERFRQQLDISEPLRKQLWAQTVKAKILNQAEVLKIVGLPNEDLIFLAQDVKSGDSGANEAQAARRYWPKLFGEEFKRERFGNYPNPLLNYGYTLLRAATARALCGSGLLPTIGIQHHNRYNHFPLADDIMEPYRPIIDLVVYNLVQTHDKELELEKQVKAELLKILTSDVFIDGQKSPLMIALTQTTYSLVECFAGTKVKLKYPEINET